MPDQQQIPDLYHINSQNLRKLCSKVVFRFGDLPFKRLRFVINALIFIFPLKLFRIEALNNVSLIQHLEFIGIVKIISFN